MTLRSGWPAAFRLVLLPALLGGFLAVSPGWAENLREPGFTAEERAMILSHGPWPPPFEPDAGNRFSGNPDAIEFGRVLFHEPLLSRDGGMSCSSCHRADSAMADGLPRAIGRRELERNTPAIANLRGRRWYGWDGRSDSLWAQSHSPTAGS